MRSAATEMPAMEAAGRVAGGVGAPEVFEAEAEAEAETGFAGEESGEDGIDAVATNEAIY